MIEIPKNSGFKYEIKNNRVILDRVLDIKCPQNYGFIPDTMAEDGDPLDVFVISKEPIQTGTFVNIEVLGVFVCKDQGTQDNKLIAKIVGTTGGDMYEREEIHYYLENYKLGFEVSHYKTTFTLKELEKYKISLKS